MACKCMFHNVGTQVQYTIRVNDSIPKIEGRGQKKNYAGKSQLWSAV